MSAGQASQLRDQRPRIAEQERPHTVGFLLVPGFALMSYAAAVEPLRAANRSGREALYRWWHAAPGGGPVAASNGVAIVPDFGPASERAADMVFVCAGGNPATFDDRATFAWLRRLARQGVTIGGISGGPYVLARAGLLDGRRATLHWEQRRPSARPSRRSTSVPSLFVLDGDRITCSGGVAALDMMVALIARDHGHELAAAVGEWFLHTHIREGMGPQRMDLRYRLGVSRREAARRAARHGGEPRDAAAARRAGPAAGVSLRQLERLFRIAISAAAPRALSRAPPRPRPPASPRDSLPVLEVALATGFGSASQFTRAFARAFGEPPSQTRRS